MIGSTRAGAVTPVRPRTPICAGPTASWRKPGCATWTVGYAGFRIGVLGCRRPPPSEGEAAGSLGLRERRVLKTSSSFVELAELWLADLDLRDLASGTKQAYRDQLRWRETCLRAPSGGQMSPVSLG